MDSELQEKEMITRLQRSELRFNITKLIVIVVAAIFTSISIIYYVRRDNDRTRDQINCIVDGFLQPSQEQVVIAEHNCRK